MTLRAGVTDRQVQVQVVDVGVGVDVDVDVDVDVVKEFSRRGQVR